MKVAFNIYRHDPATDQRPRYQRYQVEAQGHERILDCLNRIKWHQDQTLAFRLSCAHGVCGSCAMKIDGKCRLACQSLVKDFADREILVEPLPHFQVLKDLIVDMDRFFERVNFIRPYLISNQPPPDRERVQNQADRKKIDEVIRCILCACCTGACPVPEENPRYLGPAPIVQAFRRIFDTRDDEKTARLEQMADPDAAPACVNHFECTKACPKEIPVTKSINFIKREIDKVLKG
jgi:succinate dehydrogenase / fumarate reductase iron-sulfur subunit